MTCRAAVRHEVPSWLEAARVARETVRPKAVLTLTPHQQEGAEAKREGYAMAGEKVAAAIEALGDRDAALGTPGTRADGERALYDALAAIVERFEENDDPRDWPAEVREAAALLSGRRAMSEVPRRSSGRA